jgi:hypothetical protein
MASKQNGGTKRDERDDRPKDKHEGPDHAGQMMREAAEAAHTRILDDPSLPEQPSGIRHTVYFTVVMVLAFVLNLLLIVLIAR